jgi:Flp pilus assembly secretin CpaC
MKIPFTGNTSTSIRDLGWISGLGGAAVDAMTSAVAALIGEKSNEIADAYVTAGIASMNPSTITYYDAPMEQPFFHVRSIDSKVSVYPGATIVMGGLITEQRRAMDDKVPYLGDIPFLGRFFRSHSELTSKRNLLIFVTTRIIDGRGREMRNDGFQLAEQKEGEVKGAPEASEK